MKYFIPVVLVLTAAVALGKLPKGMLGAFPIMSYLGLYWE